MAIDQFYPQTSVRTTAGTWHTCWHSAEIEHRFWNPHDPDMPRHAWGMFLSDWLRSNVGFDKVNLCRSLKTLLRPPGRQTATLNQKVLNFLQENLITTHYGLEDNNHICSANVAQEFCAVMVAANNVSLRIPFHNLMSTGPTQIWNEISRNVSKSY